MDKNFGGVIWTNHALARLSDRGIKQGDAWATWKNPDQSRYATSKGAWVYYKTYGNQKIEVVAKQNERKEWLILSVWSRPVYEESKPHAKPTAKSRSLLVRLLRKLFSMD
jgi:hypothetical protein